MIAPPLLTSYDSNKPQLHPLKLTHLLSIHIQAGVQVGSCVTHQEHREQASVFLVEVELETPMPLILSQLHPDLPFWYDSMPCEPLRSVYYNGGVLYVQNALHVILLNHIRYLHDQVGDINEGDFSDLISTIFYAESKAPNLCY